MSERNVAILEMRAAGMTYEEIGQRFGISRARVGNIVRKLSENSGDHFHPAAVRKVKFVGLRNWMMNNRIGVTELGQKCNMAPDHWLFGEGDPSKRTIDTILSVTGMTYEECFRED